MTRQTAGRQAGSIMLRRIRSGTSGAEVYLLRQPDETIVVTKINRNARIRAQAPIKTWRMSPGTWRF